ncbi:helix-turn-helix domain-containing protein [Deinococcus misasensis]|uniref:helix-turn-helix domain-containing protein n=1 Tax=Deinococcus misasensis TaxID=392413 RepID=UPI0005551A8F|nr:helix-turn-helix transcriptional regulator [Deinococcus misasensis]
MRPLHSQELGKEEKQKSRPAHDKQHAYEGVQFAPQARNHTGVQHDDFLTIVRRRIKRLRLERQLRQEDMAEKLNWNLRYYQRFESQNAGESFNPKIRMFLQVAEALGITIDTLFAVSEENSPEVESTPQRVSKKLSRRKSPDGHH